MAGKQNRGQMQDERLQQNMQIAQQDTNNMQQQMNDPRAGITMDNIQKMQAMQQMQQLEQKRNEMNAHNPEHTQYGAESSNFQIIGKEQIRQAEEILRKYKDGKANLERRIIDNEQWWKLMHWKQINNKNPDVSEVKKNEIQESTSAWLFNSICNKHADIMDNYPEPSVLPRAMDDDATAKMLSSILPVVIDQNDFEQTYDNSAWYKLKTGTGVYGVFWNSQKTNGMGDIDIKQVDLLNLFWEPGIKNIQDSENIFHVSIVSNKKLKQIYPDLKIGTGEIPDVTLAKYIYDDTVDTTNMSAVVDWYYKVDVPVQTIPGVNTTKTIVHYCKYCNGTVLYASENDENYRERGYYDHGLYPFVFDVLFPEEGTPCGFGYVDIMKSPQEYIDRLSDAILRNAIVGSKPRVIIRNDSGLKEEEYINTDNEIIHSTGKIGEDAVRIVPHTNLDGIYVTVLNNKINELKETSGNRDVNQGSTSSGVTAASAIAALQEAGSKGSRDINKSSYRAYTKICNLVIELMRQFYDEPRTFRILGPKNKPDYVEFDNSGMKMQQQGNDFGIDLGSRLPIFDVNVIPAKKSAYSKMSENELAIQFYNLGFFAPSNADQTLACLEMMDFEGKDKIIDKVNENGTMFQTIQQLQGVCMQLAQQLDQLTGTNIAAQMAAAGGGMDQQINAVETNDKATGIGQSGGSQAEKAKNAAQNAATPK